MFRRAMIWSLEWIGFALFTLGGGHVRSSRLAYWGYELACLADALKPGRRWGQDPTRVGRHEARARRLDG